MSNTENINRLIQRIRDDKGVHMKMAEYVAYLDDDYREVERYEPCNTAFCLCGHANMMRLQDQGVDPLKISDFAYRMQSDEDAAEFMGIDEHTAERLFFLVNPRYSRMSFDDLPQQTRADAAIRVLEILRDTGRVDWYTAIEEASAPRQIEERSDTGLPLVDPPA